MSNVVVGSIPKKITYVFGGKSKEMVGCTWDSFDDLEYEKEEVYNTFPVDSSSEKSLATAIKWAERHSTKAKKLELDNAPISTIRVLNLECRSNGGRAYKCVIELQGKKHLFDLREDVLMDVMLKIGIQPNGIINGEFIWAKIGNHLKLIRIGSQIHNLISEYEVRANTEIISRDNLIPGTVYLDKKKEKYLFLGYFDSTEFIKNESNKNDFMKFSKKKLKNHLIFINLHRRFMELIETGTNEEFIDSIINDRYYLKFSKDHKFIEKYKSTNFVLESYLSEFRNKSLEKLKENWMYYFQHQSQYDNNSSYQAEVASKSRLIFLRNVNEPEPEIDFEELFNQVKVLKTFI
jgi:hypothetical protein